MSWKSKKSFTERWEVTRKKGRTKYCIIETGKVLLTVVLAQAIVYLFRGKLLDRFQTSDIFGACILIIIISLLSFLGWSKNEREYAVRKEQEASESESSIDENSGDNNDDIPIYDETESKEEINDENDSSVINESSDSQD